MYKPGTQNRVADALSRLHEVQSQIFAITIPHWDFLQKLQEQFKTDTQLQQLMSQVQEDPNSHPDFQVLQGILFYKGKLYIPSSSSIKNILLDEFHSSPVGGHSGIHKTYGRLKENVYWQGMKNDVTAFVNSCLTCQQMKTQPILFMACSNHYRFLKVFGRTSHWTSLLGSLPSKITQ